MLRPAALAFVALVALFALFASGIVVACADVGEPWYVARPLVVVPDGPISWSEHVQPILHAHKCDFCHSGAEPRSGLDLTTADGFVAGGDSGPAIVACDSAHSLVTSYLEECFMPPADAPGGQVCLDAAELEIMRRWIDEGAEAVYDAATCPAASR